jgi:DNA/RNA endonuclease G (NUC1)
MIEMTLPVVLQIIQTAALIVGIVYYLTIMRNQQKAQKTAEETRKIQLLMQVYQSQDVDYSQRRRDVAELEFDDYDDFYEKVDRLTWRKVMKKKM